MPFKSQAQRRLFYAKARRGEISDETLKKWNEETPKGKKLPDRVKTASFDAGAAAALKKSIESSPPPAGPVQKLREWSAERAIARDTSRLRGEGKDRYAARAEAWRKHRHKFNRQKVAATRAMKELRKMTIGLGHKGSHSLRGVPAQAKVDELVRRMKNELGYPFHGAADKKKMEALFESHYDGRSFDPGIRNPIKDPLRELAAKKVRPKDIEERARRLGDPVATRAASLKERENLMRRALKNPDFRHQKQDDAAARVRARAQKMGLT